MDGCHLSDIAKVRETKTKKKKSFVPNHIGENKKHKLFQKMNVYFTLYKKYILLKNWWRHSWIHIELIHIYKNCNSIQTKRYL